MTSEPVEFSLGGETGQLYLSEKTFEPNLTTKLLAEVAEINEGDSVLELGCGVGPLAIYAAKKGASEVYAVDIMEEACEYARRNAELNGFADRIHVCQGSVFAPVEGKKFDVIIDDVSAMSEEVARISPWYPDTIPTGGVDGTGPTLEMLSLVKDYLKPGGRLYLPVITLADHRKIINTAREIFGDAMEQVSEKLIPFCDEFKRSLPAMEALKQKGLVDYVSKRSRNLWSLYIFRATV